MNRDEFLALIEPETSIKTNTAKLGDLSVKVAEGVLTVDGHSVSTDGFKALCDRATVPWDLARRVPPHVVRPALVHLIKEREDSETVVFTQRDEIIGFGDPNRNTMTNLSLFQKMEAALGTVTEVEDAKINFFDSTFTIIGDQAVEPKQGDIVKGGIRAYNSVVGRYEPTLSLINYRLVCSNGMVAPDHTSQIGFKVRETTTVEDVVRALWGDVGVFLNQFKDTVNVTLNGHLDDEVLASLFDQYGIPVRARKHVMDLIAEHGAVTLYDLLNHITYVGTHHVHSGGSTHRLQEVAGRIAQSRVDVCSGCHRPLVHAN